MPRIKPRVPILQRGHPIARGLVGLWPMAEGSGPKAGDLVAGRAATFASTAAWAAGPAGPVVALNGSSDYLSAPYGASMNVPQVTVAALFRCDVAVNQAIVLNRNYDGSVVALHLSVAGTNNPGFGFFSGAWHTSGLTRAVSGDGLWHLGVGTYDGVTLRYYLDGRLDASAAFSGSAPTTSTQPLDFGRYANDSSYFAGRIGTVGLWSRAFSAGEVAALHADLYVLISPPTGKKYFIATASAPSFAAVSAGSLAAPTAVASVVKAFPATASSSLSTPTAVATSGLVNRYVVVASSSLSGPSAVASAVLTWTVVASSSLAAPTATATVGAINLYPSTSSGSLASPSAVASVALVWAATASGILSSPTDVATVGLANLYAATSSGFLPTPTGTASAVLAWTVVASGSLPSPTAVATSGLVNRFPVVTTAALASPTATAVVTTAAVGTYSVSSSGTIPAPTAVATSGLTNRYPVVSSGFLPSPTAVASASVLDSYAVLSSGLLTTPTAVASAEWQQQAEFAATAVGSLVSPSATANVIVVVSPSGISFPRGSSGNPPGLRGYQR